MTATLRATAANPDGLDNAPGAQFRSQPMMVYVVDNFRL